LQSACFPFSIKLSISHQRLPSIPAFNTLCANLLNHILAANDQDYGAFVTLTETAIELDTIFCSVNQASRPLHSQNTLSSNITPTSHAPLLPKSTSMPISSSIPTPTSTAGSLKLCLNCGHSGHWVTTCFEPGGGMEGCQAEGIKARSSLCC
jgi:hypothetical protein